MSTKHFCDGCDNEYSATVLTTINVAWRGTRGQSDSLFGPTDLCEGCLARFKTAANPQNWPRAKKARPDE